MPLEKYATLCETGTDREAYAEACRAAGLAFLDGVQGGAGWGKADLTAWLVGPYQSVTRRIAGTAPIDARLAAMVPFTETASAELADLVRIAVASAIAGLRSGDTSCVAHAMRNNDVASDHDAGGVGWVAMDRPGARLDARVLSLFVVDYLLRSEHYAPGEVSVCGACDTVRFDGGNACSHCRAAAAVRSSHVDCLDEGAAPPHRALRR